jgi:hypothetical protein
MARIRNRKVSHAVEAVASAELAQAEQVQSVMVVKIKVPVWLHTHKAQRGEVVTVDPELGRRLIERGQADGYAD